MYFFNPYTIQTSGPTMAFEDKIDILRQKLIDADAVVIGAGSGLSTAAGYTYTGERFDKYFSDFSKKYEFSDMYSGGFFPYQTMAEFWGFWCRYIWINRYAPIPSDLYQRILDLVKDKDYFVLTTNVDHCFQRAGFDKHRLFYTQGDYGLFQSSEPQGASAAKTYDNYDIIKQMILAEGYEIGNDYSLIIPDGASIKMSVPEELVYTVQSEVLHDITEEKGITDSDTLPHSEKDSRLSVWQGDITTLKVDAIVNAANSQMLGCFSPLHSCIDNMIHTMAGVELREKCYQIMKAQGKEEEIGRAKITPGYDLPAKYVIHTVGPICYDKVTAEERKLLASCYTSVLDIASEYGLSSVAFCCISTGVFRFPQEEAAQIAVKTVHDWLCSNPYSSICHVIFNVFKDADREIYDSLLA